MTETELQKVETVMFQINQDGEASFGLLWKDGSLYLSISKLMLTDGNSWYAIPFSELKDIVPGEDGCISLKIDGAEVRMKGENAERLMALRHLLLPLIERRPDDEEIMEEIVKMILIGIRERSIMASLLKRSVDEIDRVMEKAEKLGYISDGEVTEKGKALLSEEDVETMKRAGVKL